MYKPVRPGSSAEGGVFAYAHRVTRLRSGVYVGEDDAHGAGVEAALDVAVAALVGDADEGGYVGGEGGGAEGCEGGEGELGVLCVDEEG